MKLPPLTKVLAQKRYLPAENRSLYGTIINNYGVYNFKLFELHASQHHIKVVGGSELQEKDMKEKKEYHEPEIRDHGKLTVVTQDAFDDPFALDDIECWYGFY